MAEIDYRSDKNRAHEKAEGSDGRLNVSSRTDGRDYYNSRDQGLTFSTPFCFIGGEAGEFASYYKNTSSTYNFVVSHIMISADVAATFKLWFVSGTAAAGTTVTPTNDNRTKQSNAAPAIAMEGNTAPTGITGLTGEALIENLMTSASSTSEFVTGDTLILGQNDAIAVEYESGSTAAIYGTIFGYFE